MSILRKLDERVIRFTQAHCQQIERVTGKSNFFWMKILSGALATFLFCIVYVFEHFNLTQHSLESVLLFVIALFVFLCSFLFCDWAETAARESARTGIANPHKSARPTTEIRLSFMISCVIFSVVSIVAVAKLPVLISHTPTMLIMLGTIFTLSSIWYFLILDACDPLPPNPNSAQS